MICRKVILTHNCFFFLLYRKKIFPCSMCSKTYKTSHGLKNHFNSQHNPASAQNRPAVLQVNGTTCNASTTNLAISSNGIQIKQDMPAQVTSFVQISTTPSIKTEISPSVKETLLNSLQNTINKSKGGVPHSLINGKFIKLDGGGSATTAFPLSAEIISDTNCPVVCSNVEVMSEPKTLSHITIKSPPIISAPTLQQHLLSPIIPKVASS